MPPSAYWYCSILIFISLTTVMCSTLFILSMTFQRFYGIIIPHKAASFNTVKKAKIVTGCIVVLSIGFNFPHLFLSDTQSRYCIANRIASVNVYGALYYWLSFIVSFALPFVLLLIMNSVIIHTLRQRSRLGLVRSEGQNEGQDTKSKNSEFQIFIMLLLVTFLFLILTTPMYVLIFYVNFYQGNTLYYYAGYYLFYNVGEKSFFTNNGINFFLYVMSGQKFRSDLVKLFHCNRINQSDTHVFSLP